MPTMSALPLLALSTQLAVTLVAGGHGCAAEDKGIQIIGGLAKSTSGDLEDFTGDNRAVWVQASAQLSIQGTADYTWLDVGGRISSGDLGDGKMFYACWSDRAPLLPGIGLVLGGGLAYATASSSETTIGDKSGWGPVLEVGLDLTLGGGIMAEGLYQWLPSKFDGLDLSGFMVGVGIRF